jgi:hypothetical protein
MHAIYNKASYFWFTCDISQVQQVINTPPLIVKIYINDIQIYNNTIQLSNKLTVPIPNIPNKTNNILFIICGKTDDHTLVDASGNITASTSVMVDNITISGVNLSIIPPNIVSSAKVICYTHNYNGYRITVNEVLDNNLMLSYNGIVKLSFTTPIYDWLLNLE